MLKPKRSRVSHEIGFHDDVLTFLIQKGFDKYLGARPLRDAMEKYIRSPIADCVIRYATPAIRGRLAVHPAKTHLLLQEATR